MDQLLSTLSAVEIAAERVLLRKARDSDRGRLIELRTDAEVAAYIGGPRRREDVERYLDEIGGMANATDDPGTFIIADRATDAFLGTIELDRRAPDQPGRVTDAGEELELSYLLHRDAWGVGLATEATTAVLRAAAGELSDQPVLVVTQSANTRSLGLAARLGFRPVTIFEQFDAEQTLLAADLHLFEK
ncbi:GNAT family N-acetyltransferase [Nocardia sp. AG03]|uniref:GNAT family N-acetyltransferase n=1 Tax=Nocardia sp. AG03 TaxID=3025312 RepID=UPI0024184421|nr:GNAT family N-acetyltransferase [Nocardia sp. AG03]